MFCLSSTLSSVYTRKKSQVKLFLKLVLYQCFLTPPAMEQSLPHSQECDGWHPCIHHYKWRLSGLRSNHGWVKVYHSLWQPFTSTLHRSPLWSMSRTLLDCLQEGGAVREGWQKYREIEKKERHRGREKLLDICFVLSSQWPQDNVSTAKLKHNWLWSEIL